MIQRRRAREVVLQLLFQRDFNASLTEQQAEAFVRGRLRQQNLQEFALALYQGVVENLPAIDEELSSVAENWRLSRMSGIDRNVLRIGAYELMFSKETPPAAVLNEAIELAKRFGSEDSPGFVNGVLDKIRERKQNRNDTVTQ